MDISIIIPIYNAEKFLMRCVVSVVNSLMEYDGKGEIILIDNNSSDNSLALAEDLARKYRGLIKVLQCHTPGAGAVRNFGVEKAKGEYLWFIDADDKITKNAITKLISEAEHTNADLVVLGFTKVYQGGKKEKRSVSDIKDPKFRSKFILSQPGPWQVVIRRRWYVKEGFKFIEGKIHEDMDLMPALILHTDNIAIVNEQVYMYYQNSDSVLHKTTWDPHYFDIFPALKGLYVRFKKAGAVEQYRDELEWFFIWNLLIDSAEYYIKFKEGKSGLKRSRKMLKQYFPNWKNNKFLKNTNFKTHLKILMNYYHW
ncbi:glycosyltransferase family 2 protein [Candidatus Saccharibacteria bacterium]|nr:glycosyltransferase family 2 protein [Candidatus Saccharibacteria bacterium]